MTGPPVWVWALLALLILLGIRRLSTREVPAAVALLPAAAFLAWNLWNGYAYAVAASSLAATIAISVGASIGLASALLLPEPRGLRLADGRVRLPGTALPLLLYLGVFAARFACGAWEAIAPAYALTAKGIALAVGVGATCRLIAGVARWVHAPAAA